MPTVYDVPPDVLLKRLAEHLKRVSQIVQPPWSAYVKTGYHAERRPQDREWWHMRCASLLRKLYVHGPLGLRELESEYGGRKRMGYSAARHRNAGGAIIRKALKQVEAAGYVEKKPKQGRVLTSKGVSLLDRLSSQIFGELVQTNPSLARYG